MLQRSLSFEGKFIDYFKAFYFKHTNQKQKYSAGKNNVGE